MSVPHSGTRTLVQLLSFDAKARRLRGGKWWHFGNCAALLRHYRVHAHIPIRRPLDVARSWAQRGKSGDVLGDLLRRYDHMFAHIAAHEADCSFYRMEDLPRLAGTGEHRGAAADSGRIRAYRAAVLERVIVPHEAFFLRFYTRDELHGQPGHDLGPGAAP